MQLKPDMKTLERNLAKNYTTRFGLETLNCPWHRLFWAGGAVKSVYSTQEIPLDFQSAEG